MRGAAQAVVSGMALSLHSGSGNLHHFESIQPGGEAQVRVAIFQIACLPLVRRICSTEANSER